MSKLPYIFNNVYANMAFGANFVDEILIKCSFATIR